MIPAAELLKLALEAVIQTGVGKLTEGTLVRLRELWDSIYKRIGSNSQAKAALEAAEREKSTAALEPAVPILEAEIVSDPAFGERLQNLAREIRKEMKVESQDTIDMNATAHDQSTVKQVGKIQANEVNF